MVLFSEKVYKLTAQIPKGKVSTYKNIAATLRKPKAARAVGQILNKNPHPKTVPCHRVVRSDGATGGYVQGNKNKTSLLKKEGVEIEEGQVNLKKFLFKDFTV